MGKYLAAVSEECWRKWGLWTSGAEQKKSQKCEGRKRAGRCGESRVTGGGRGKVGRMKYEGINHLLREI
jgi:hypothetical protein